MAGNKNSGRRPGPPKPIPPPRACAHCRTLMVGRRRKFCDKRCRQQAIYVKQATDATCVKCGVVFRTVSKRAAVCKPCRMVVLANAYRLHIKSKGYRSRDRVCVGCGAPFRIKHPSSRNAGKFCSRQCCGNHRRAMPKPAKAAPSFVCSECACRFSGRSRKYCSDKCRNKVAYRRTYAAYVKGKTAAKAAAPARVCRECEAEFKPAFKVKHRYFCSKRCSKRHASRNSKAVRRTVDRRGNVNVFGVFRAAGWVCQWCGIETPRKLRGTYSPQAPELDHIVPVSRGGESVTSNCQLLCRKCNRDKGARPHPPHAARAAYQKCKKATALEPRPRRARIFQMGLVGFSDQRQVGIAPSIRWARDSAELERDLQSGFAQIAALEAASATMAARIGSL